MFGITLPEIEELDNMEYLDILDLYRIEIHHLSQVEGKEREALYELARQGDQEARYTLIFHCLAYLLAKAYHIYDERRPAHIDLLDLVGEANVFMLEKMDIALAKREPISYLFAMTLNHMEHYCTYNAPLIQRPFGLNSEVLASRQQYTSVESLDKPITAEDGTPFRVDRIQAPSSPSIMGNDEEYFNARFSPLHEAMKRLTSTQQTTIVRFYGLFDQPANTTLELSKEWHVTPETVNANKRAGYRKLKAVLAKDLDEMLYWNQEGGEEE